MGTRRLGAPAGVVVAAAALAPFVWAAEVAAESSAEEIAALVQRLGADDYAEREAAAARLSAIGPAAVDPLLAAAELSPDLEVALRARWIVDVIPLDVAGDPPEVAKLLDAFKRKEFAERVQVMQQLLRVEDDGGIEPLARIVRLDRSPLGSRVAAALLAREWRHDNPYWPGMGGRITAGLGGSTRPAAVFLRSLVAATAAEAPDASEKPIDSIRESLAQLLQPVAIPATGDAAEAVGRQLAADGETTVPDAVAEWTRRIFSRCRVELLLATGRRADALAEAELMMRDRFATADRDPGEAAEETAGTLAWLTECGLPEAVDIAIPPALRDDPLVGYAMAVAERSRRATEKAEVLASAAFAKPAGSPAEFVDRLQAAMLLVRWGAGDWAAREYAVLIENQRVPEPQFALASIMFSEHLHDQEREVEAAACLQRLVEGRKGQAEGRGDLDRILRQIGREQQDIRSRMHFFESCAAAARGDAVGRRKSIEQSLRSSPKDVDALIALYALPDNTPEQKADAGKRIKRALEQIENEIQAVPADSTGYNEFAWLVANTEGDLQKATRYSKISLEKSFDSASFLDTLAHCHAAAGNLGSAVRTQTLALRQDPHNLTIRRNLERFRERSAAPGSKPSTP